MPRLHRDLIPHLTTHALNHPLLQASPYVGDYNAIYNREYRSKRSELEQAKSSSNWRKVIWLHERPFRAAALEEIAAAMTDEQYWAMVSEVWLDSDRQESRWVRLWSSKRLRRDRVMRDSEHKLLAQLPAPIAIYRAYHGPQKRAGLSWTTQRAAALAMAQRPGNGPAYLATASVQPRYIQALFVNRGSQPNPEVVVLPRHQANRQVRQL